MSNSTTNSHWFGTNNEWAVDELMVIFIFIFLLTLLAQHLVTHVFRFSFLGDAGTAMSTFTLFHTHSNTLTHSKTKNSHGINMRSICKIDQIR